MKVLGIKQFHQKTFKRLNLKNSKFKGILGNVPKYFTAVVYGYSGNGKTEFVMQLIKELTQHGKVLWLSYEQRHGFDLQTATKRNNMHDESGRFLVSDPLEDLPENMTLLEDLDNCLSTVNANNEEVMRRGSADYIVIDSIDYTGFTMSDYKFLKNKYFEKKGFIFIAHSTKSGIFRKKIGEDIMFDGGLGIFVSKFIATPEKNRFGGVEPYVVYEERARALNPLFFEKGRKQN